MLGLSVIILFKSLLHVFCSLVFSAHNSSAPHYYSKYEIWPKIEKLWTIPLNQIKSTLSITNWFLLFDLMYCTLYCVVFCPKTSLINLSSIARFLGCLPVQKWGMGQILDPRRRSRFLHHLSSSSPRSYKASTWSASSEWWPSPSSPFKVVASEQSEWWLSVHDILHFLPHNDPTQVHLSFWRATHPNPAVKFCFPWKSFNLETVRRFDSFGPVKKLASGISTL